MYGKGGREKKRQRKLGREKMRSDDVFGLDSIDVFLLENRCSFFLLLIYLYK